MPRPAATLILVTRRSVARADFSRRGLLEHWERPRPDLPDVGSAVELAVALQEQVSRRSWVLATDFWTQTVTWPSSRAAGLSNEDITNALNFECESLSGVDGTSAAAAFTPLPASPGHKAFWLTQVRLSDREFIQEVLAAHGGKLEGLLHPAGCPGGETRIELWPDAVAAVNDGIRIANSDPSSRRWEQELAAWLREHPGAVETGLEGTGVKRVIDSETIIKQWHDALLKSAAVPVVAVPSKPMSAGLRKLITATIACAASVACAALWITQEKKLERLKKELDETRGAGVQKETLIKAVWAQATKDAEQKLQTDERTANDAARKEQEAARLMNLSEVRRMTAERTKEEAALKDRMERGADLEKKGKTAESELAEARTEEAKRVHAERRLRHLQERHAALLAALADGRPDEVVIQQIELQADSTRVRGVTLKLGAADRFAEKLAKPLAELGWELRQPRQAPITDISTPGSGPWAFEFSLHEREPRP